MRYLAGKFVRRYRRPLAVATAVLLVLAAIGRGGGLADSQRARPGG
jgi:hypothetical protein